jgi:hypothetical protein
MRRLNKMAQRGDRAKLEAIFAAEGESLVRTAIGMALAGDSSALKQSLDRLMPPVKERLIKVALPPVASANDVPAAIAAVVGAVSRGELPTSEGTALVSMISAMRQAYELVDLAARLEAVERALPGPHAGPGTASSTGGHQ